MLRLILLLALMPGTAWAEVLVATRAIRAQSVLTAADLTVASLDRPGALSRIDEAVGLETRIALYPGRPILPGDVGPPAVVERNQMVEMRFLSGGLTIVTEGRALDRARPGERLRVMNLTSRATVTGMATEAGWVRVGP